MTVPYVINHIPKTTPSNRRPAYSMNATTITIHNTGNPSSSAVNERNWLTNPSNPRQASFHIGIDEYGAIECLPLNENAWHSGDGNSLTSGNRTSIGIELCECGSYTKTLQNAIELVAKMLKERGWGVDRLRRHYDWSGKICPRLMYDEGKWTGWIEFKKRVDDVLNPKVVSVKPVVSTPTKTLPTITKERVYAENGVLKRCDGNYKIAATDVRHLKLNKGSYDLKFVWAKGKKVSELCKEYGADFALNFSLFWIDSPVSDTKIGEQIIANVTSGKTVAWSGFKFKDGIPSIGKIDVNEDLVSGFAVKSTPLLLENGKCVYEQSIKTDLTATDISNSRCQRTALGIDSSGNLHCIIGDGRTTYDRGMTIQETALYLQSKGCVSGINGDGGGSSIICDGVNGALNQKLNTGENERIVNHALLIFIKPDKEIKNEIPDKEFDEMDKIKVDLKNGDKKIVVDAFLTNGKSYVELREFAEFLEATVSWDQVNKRASVTKK